MPHLCREWLDRIKSVEREHLVARLAVDRLVEAARLDSSILGPSLRLRDASMASERLDGTYVIRLFAEFETALRSYWKSIKRTDPPTRDLLDGIAARCRIPADVRTDAQGVRDDRNHLVHEREDVLVERSVAGARHALCRFLSRLPEEWDE